MPRGLRYIAIVIGMLAIVAPAGARPGVELAEDGRSFVYYARPGDTPAAVAARFRIGPAELPAFLAANGITDPGRVPPGFAYRVPNPLATEIEDTTARAAGLERGLAARTAELAERDRMLAPLRDAAAAGSAASARLEPLERQVRIAWSAFAVALLLLAIAGWAAIIALRDRQRAEKWSRAMAKEVEDRRRSALAERQQSAKRILVLEERLRELEAQHDVRLRIRGHAG